MIHFQIQEAYALLRLGYNLDARNKLKEYLKYRSSDSMGWYYFAYCQFELKDKIFCLEKALESFYGYYRDREREHERIMNSMRWIKREEDYEYKKINLPIPMHREKIEGDKPESYYEQIYKFTNDWWLRDKDDLLLRIKRLQDSGWEILSEEGTESYVLKLQSVFAAIDFFSKRKTVIHQTPEERLLQNDETDKKIKEFLGVVAGITFVFIFATGGVGIVIAPIIIIGGILYALFHKINYLQTESYQVLMRRKKEAG